MARVVARTTTVPYCICVGGEKGWTKHLGDNPFWVHPNCGKVSRLVYLRHGKP